MSRKALIGGVAVGLVLLAAAGCYALLRGAPAFYEAAARQQDPEAAARASDAFLQQVMGIASDMRRLGAWEAQITAEQMNGWLAVDAPNNHPNLTPPEFSDPRISISPGDLTFAGRYRHARLNTVLSISCDVYLSAPNVIAIRVKSMRAGLAPLPLGQALDAITHAAQTIGAPLEWRRDGDDPVALISIVPQDSDSGRDRSVTIDRIELREGELYVAGRTGPLTPLSTATRLRPVETAPESIAPPAPVQAESPPENGVESGAENDTLQR